MTNLNTNTTTTSNTTIEATTMNTLNKSALLSTISAELFHNGLVPAVALITATAYVGAVEYMDDAESFVEALKDGLENTSIDVKDQTIEFDMDGDAIVTALVNAGYLDIDLGVGTRFAEVAEIEKESYAPALASEGVTRKFGYAPVKGQASDLFKEATHALESSEFTVDDTMLSIALQVQAVLGADNDDEGYVLAGAQQMDSSESYVSEFKGDRRGRLYQAACFGPNGQASDRSRALMDLANVPTDYDVDVVKKAIRAEVMDMVSCPESEVGKLMTEAVRNPVQFIIDRPEMKKSYSFVKAALIWKELMKGNKPYIGMAVGLDAKCSGPQLGALMVGDQAIAAATGFSMVELDDAYALAIVELEKAGFTGFTRSIVKKPYMGIFYGQGAAAFTSVKEEYPELHACIYGSANSPADDDTAKAFHAAVEKSFGAKMAAVRKMFKGYEVGGKVSHMMPDGFRVEMNYKQKVNVFGELMTFDTEKHDVFLQNNMESYKFINLQMNTTATHTADFVRNGFVNMIQATDALLARLIIVHLKRLGAQHIVAVHDCFRVNVTEMHLLEQAIINAYQDLFGSRTNVATKDLPKGQDIIGMYFDGINKVATSNQVHASQFMGERQVRRMTKVNGELVGDLIQALGTTYYFAK